MHHGSEQQFGNYRLERLLGRGGFADVYLGRHIHLDTLAAIKILHLQLSESNREQFHAEARLIARLAHPSIVRVLDYGVEKQTPFLVMEYASNGTLAQRYRHHTCVPLEQIVSYVRQIATALQFAHERKIVHRDIKPQNMLINEHDAVLLSDFGIALVMHSSRTHSQQALAGTAAYMAPEQIKGHPCPASDQYALGIAVYTWLCGERPFRGTFVELCAQHLYKEPPALREKVSTVPAAIEQAVLKTLAKKPEERFASVQAFADALHDAADRMLSPSSISSLHGFSEPSGFAPVSDIVPEATLLQPGSLQPHIPPVNSFPVPSAGPAEQIPDTLSPAHERSLAPTSTPDSQPDLQTFTTPAMQEPATGQRPEMSAQVPLMRFLPPWSHTRRGRTIALLVLLALLIIGGSSGFFFNKFAAGQPRLAAIAKGSDSTPDPQTNTIGTAATEATPTAGAATQANATATADAAPHATATARQEIKTPQGLYTLVTSQPPLVNDSLSGQGASNWGENSNTDGSGCRFKNGALHLLVSPSQDVWWCTSRANTYGNFAFQVQMTILTNTTLLAGLVLRNDNVLHREYLYQLTPEGSFQFIIYDGATQVTTTLSRSTSQFIHRGLGQPNLLTVIARGPVLDLYINKHFVAVVQNSAVSTGLLGFLAGYPGTGESGDIAYSNAQIWDLTNF